MVGFGALVVGTLVGFGVGGRVGTGLGAGVGVLVGFGVGGRVGTGADVGALVFGALVGYN